MHVLYIHIIYSMCWFYYGKGSVFWVSFAVLEGRKTFQAPTFLALVAVFWSELYETAGAQKPCNFFNGRRVHHSQNCILQSRLQLLLLYMVSRMYRAN